MSKLNVAVYWAGSCGGCDIAVLEIHERLLTLLDHADIVFWPCVMDTKVADVERMLDDSIDACLFNGAICTTENRAMAQLLRRKSKVLVAYGACAAMGGVPGLANLAPRHEMFDRIYRSSISTRNAEGTLPRDHTEIKPGVSIELPALLPQVLPLSGVVDVDFFVPGCPPTAERTWQVLEALVQGTLPEIGAVVGAGDKAVCDECPLRKDDTKIARFRRIVDTSPEPERCLLDQGIVCSGPATRSGCGAECLDAGFPCRGCYGPAGDSVDQGTAMIALLGGLVEATTEAGIEDVMGSIADPVGTLYRFGLPASLLARVPRPGARGGGKEQ